MVSKGNQFKFAPIVLLAVMISEEAETWLPSFCVQCVLTIIRFDFWGLMLSIQSTKSEADLGCQ